MLLNDPPRERQEGAGKYSPLDAILEKSDIITFHVPLIRTGSDATFHLADRSFFERASKQPFLINSSRGEVVDNAALKEALKTGKLRGAALDVWENEPEIDLGLLNLLDYATPHIAGYSADGKANGTSMSVNALASFFALPLYEFEPDVPRPEDPLIRIPSEGASEEQLAKAVFRSYDILSDDQRLRMSPAAFEKLRGDYPLRREFAAYRISGADDLATTYSGLGFQIVKEQ